MGCICSKAKSANEYVANNHRELNNKSNRSSSKVVTTENEATAHLISNNTSRDRDHDRDREASFTPVSSDEGEKEKNAKPVLVQNQNAQPRVSRVFSITGGERGAQVLAGWPSWLTAVAGEAISGWIPRRADSFEKLDKIGQGTYSSVYRARDLETKKIVALKKVRFANMDPESVRFMAREIIVLRRLDHPNVMKLEGMITSRVSGSLYLIFEYMDHDLAGLATIPGVKFTEPQVPHTNLSHF